MTGFSVTIGITAHNAAETIEAAIDSALGQSVPIQQIVIVDDASDDQTITVLEKYGNCPNIEVVQLPRNRGVAAARNEIVKRATGVFICFFDDDDVSAPNRIALQRERILIYERDFANGAPVICHTARRQIYADGSGRIEAAMGSEPGLAPHGLEVIRYTLTGEPMRGGYGSCATCSQMARTETYRALGGFDERLRRCEDSDLVLRHARAGGHLVGLSEPLVTQRMTSTSDKSAEVLRTYFNMLLDKHSDAFDTSGQYKFSKRWIQLKFDWLAGRRYRFVASLVVLGLRHPLQTRRRILAALPNMSGNLAFRRFVRAVS